MLQQPTAGCPDCQIVKENVMRKETEYIIDEEFVCSFVSGLLLWHWLSVENINRKTTVRMIITKAQLMSVRCDVINFLRAHVFLIGLLKSSESRDD